MNKQELRQDIFRENIVKGMQYINENIATAIKIIVVIIIIVAGMSYYNNLGSAKRESAAHLAGRAQNIFINGNLDEALVKFERVLNNYPNTPGAVQSLVYLLNDAITNNNIDTINKLLAKNDGKIEDPIIMSAIYKLKGDVLLVQGDHSSAIKNYQKAESIMNKNNIPIQHQLDIVSVLLAQTNYVDALSALENIIKTDDIGFNEKNQAEELMAYVKQKMGI